MSRIYPVDEKIELDELVANAQHVVLAKKVGTEELVKVTLPLETHIHKESDTVYKENADRYEVIDVLYASPAGDIKSGDSIRLRLPRPYDYSLVKRYHEEGVSKSIQVPKYMPHAKPNPDEPVILFLQPWSGKTGTFTSAEYDKDDEGRALKAPNRGVFTSEGIEGLGSLEAVKDIIQKNKKEHIPAPKPIQ